ncbi:Gfo/Idh/MocA family oxidoreductase [Dyadobacter fanqingshengii]|uniref:Gfo/Idh/MocA family oxidoreductase n=1 Tax=Dyadobacter fanqingshengii TaxID=2906443 RepID=A0A9X1T890_9BACT|nr:Gfo/Idh/MocA family oxidoreductase [Dyadobacter fanqingshengii]MCF0039441.1 Gfo/Idh/MocA family oxidoreductase [Dyadobacter fanqingshengii]MCF2503017.1 Gfo/Idh/MocA family oxidoreductase [Dyadobacter fanqingshengii]USJ33748.1 Gfo/Idh/MocA family oxidoreductase [Dyadobacter fanqingshengii]
MASRILNVGLIGFGLSGRYFHSPFLSTNPGFKIKTVVERSKNEAQEFDPNIGNARSVEELLSDESIDLVFICTPNETHFPYAMDALENGKHVVIEKPFSATEEEARQLVALAEQKGLILTAYQNRRWDSDFLTIKKLIAEDKLGDIVEYECRYDRFRPVVPTESWKEKSVPVGGNLYNLGPHLIDQALVLFGEPLTVTAEIRSVRPNSEIDDYFDVRLGYADKLVIVKSSLMVYENFLRYNLHGTKGSFIKGGLDPQEETLRKNILPTEKPWGVEPENRWGKLYSEDFTGVVESEAGDYAPFYQNVYDAIVNGAGLAVKPAEIIRTTRVIDLAFQSSREKQVMTY